MPNYVNLKIVRNSYTDILDGGNTLVSPQWYVSNGSYLTTSHRLVARANGARTQVASTGADIGDTQVITKFQVYLSNETFQKVLIKYI